MGNVNAASPPPLAKPPGIGIPPPEAPGSQSIDDMPQMPAEHKPGPFEDLHKKTKGEFRCPIQI